MLSTIFKLYDIRGKYPSQINEIVVFDIIRKFPMLFGEGTRVIVGHDARHSSPSLYKTAIKTLCEMNYTVIAAGVITTPELMFLAKHFKFKKDIGIMITASHNPKDQNGIKIIDQHLNVMGGIDLLGKITQFFVAPEGKVPLKNAPVREKSAEARKMYVRFLESFIEKKNHDTKSGSRLKRRGKLCVVIDCSNGSSGPIIQKIKFPPYMRPIFINTRPDGNFPAHSPNPLDEASLQDVKKAIKKNKADFGVVLDGDGDRAVFVDNKARRVRSEYIWRLIMGNERYTKTVVTELNAYLISKLSSDPQMKQVKISSSKVGRESFLRAMKNANADFGFENSGHYYFKEFFYGDSGIVAILKVVNALGALPYALSDFIDMLPQTVRLPEADIPARHATAELYHTLADMLREKAQRVSFFEGVSLHIGGTFVNVRISNTEGIIRVNVEGEDKKKVADLLARTTKLVREMGK